MMSNHIYEEAFNITTGDKTNNMDVISVEMNKAYNIAKISCVPNEAYDVNNIHVLS